MARYTGPIIAIVTSYRLNGVQYQQNDTKRGEFTLIGGTQMQH